ncbi:MAG: hypothetical protein AB7P33_14570 [Dehalococcoidia bacterium]
MKQLESIGIQIESGLSQIDRQVDSPLKASLLGVALGFGVIAAGITAFLVVLFVLVNLFA